MSGKPILRIEHFFVGLEMRAIVVNPPAKGFEVKDVQIQEKGVKIKILENGICGTDREIVNGQLSTAAGPSGYNFMALGHEAIGEVMEGSGDFRKGDIVMPVNRRGCGKCLNCLIGRPDFCETGEFIEAGIKGMHGFMREYIYDSPEFLVHVPSDIREIAITAQPLSDLEKSLEEILSVQGRLYWKCRDATYRCRHALVVDTGAIGILFALLLRSRGFMVTISNRRDPTQVEARIFQEAGISFFNSSKGYSELGTGNAFDLVVEASGSDASILPTLLQLLKNNAVLGLFGFMRSGSAILSNTDIQNLVYKSISVVGLINGQKPHFEAAMRDLVQWKHVWPGIIESMITRGTIQEVEQNGNILLNKQPDEIKMKIIW